MSPEAEQLPPLPAAAHRPIHVVPQLHERLFAAHATWIDYLFRYGRLVVFIPAVAAMMSRSNLATPFFFIGMALSATIAIFGLMRKSFRAKNEFLRLKAASFRFCADCGYDLRGCPAEGACPECGASYDAEFLEHTWIVSYKSSITVISDDDLDIQLRAINEARRRRVQSYQSTNKESDSTPPALPPG